MGVERAFSLARLFAPGWDGFSCRVALVFAGVAIVNRTHKAPVIPGERKVRGPGSREG